MATKKAATTKVATNKIKCSDCGCEKAGNPQNYFKSNRDEYSDTGYCTTCKNCLINSTIDNDGSVTMESIKYALKKLDKPLVEKVFMEVKNGKDKKGNSIINKKFLGEYSKQLNLYDEYKNCRFSDTVDIQIKQEKILNAKIDKEKNEEVTHDMIMFWGKGLANEDYIDLQAKFDKFMENEEDPNNLDYKKELDYKKLVIWEFQLSKIQYDLDKIKEASQLQKNIAELSNDLGIKAIQRKEDNSNKGAYDLFIKKIESTKPVFDFERDLGNRDEVKEVLELWFYAYLMDVNNVKTSHTNKLYEEIDKYTPNEDEFSDGDN